MPAAKRSCDFEFLCPKSGQITPKSRYFSQTATFYPKYDYVLLFLFFEWCIAWGVLNYANLASVFNSRYQRLYNDWIQQREWPVVSFLAWR